MAGWTQQFEASCRVRWADRQRLSLREVRLPLHCACLLDTHSCLDCNILYRRDTSPTTGRWSTLWHSLGHLPDLVHHLRVGVLSRGAQRLPDDLGELLLG